MTPVSPVQRVASAPALLDRQAAKPHRDRHRRDRSGRRAAPREVLPLLRQPAILDRARRARRRLHGRKADTVTEPEPDEYELYDLTLDPIEERNLAHPTHADDSSRALQKTMLELLTADSPPNASHPQPADDPATSRPRAANPDAVPARLPQTLGHEDAVADPGASLSASSGVRAMRGVAVANATARHHGRQALLAQAATNGDQR